MYTSRQSDSPKGLWTHTVLTLNPADPSLSTEICTGPLSPPELHYSQMGRAPSSVRCREMPFLGSGGCCSTSSMPAPAESSRSPPGWVRGHRPAGRAFPGKQVSRGPPESRLMRTIRIIIVHGKGKSREGNCSDFVGSERSPKRRNWQSSYERPLPLNGYSERSPQL